jgi:uncharacterized protein
MSDELMHKLEERLGPLHARQRLGIEKDHEAQVFGQGLTFFHLENWYSAPAIIRTVLKLTGLYWRAQRNAESIVVRRNDLTFSTLPPSFDGFTILHISDLHADMKIVENILEGKQLASLELEGLLKKFPIEWYQQLEALTRIE